MRPRRKDTDTSTLESELSEASPLKQKKKGRRKIRQTEEFHQTFNQTLTSDTSPKEVNQKTKKSSKLVLLPQIDNVAIDNEIIEATTKSAMPEHENIPKKRGRKKKKKSSDKENLANADNASTEDTGSTTADTSKTNNLVAIKKKRGRKKKRNSDQQTINVSQENSSTLSKSLSESPLDITQNEPLVNPKRDSIIKEDCMTNNSKHVEEDSTILSKSHSDSPSNTSKNVSLVKRDSTVKEDSINNLNESQSADDSDISVNLKPIKTVFVNDSTESSDYTQNDNNILSTIKEDLYNICDMKEQPVKRNSNIASETLEDHVEMSNADQPVESEVLTHQNTENEPETSEEIDKSTTTTKKMSTRTSVKRQSVLTPVGKKLTRHSTVTLSSQFKNQQRSTSGATPVAKKLMTRHSAAAQTVSKSAATPVTRKSVARITTGATPSTSQKVSTPITKKSVTRQSLSTNFASKKSITRQLAVSESLNDLSSQVQSLSSTPKETNSILKKNTQSEGNLPSDKKLRHTLHFTSRGNKQIDSLGSKDDSIIMLDDLDESEDPKERKERSASFIVVSDNDTYDLNDKEMSDESEKSAHNVSNTSEGDSTEHVVNEKEPVNQSRKRSTGVSRQSETKQALEDSLKENVRTRTSNLHERQSVATPFRKSKNKKSTPTVNDPISLQSLSNLTRKTGSILKRRSRSLNELPTNEGRNKVKKSVSFVPRESKRIRNNTYNKEDDESPKKLFGNDSSILSNSSTPTKTPLTSLKSPGKTPMRKSKTSREDSELNSTFEKENSTLSATSPIESETLNNTYDKNEPQLETDKSPEKTSLNDSSTSMIKTKTTTDNLHLGGSLENEDLCNTTFNKEDIECCETSNGRLDKSGKNNLSKISLFRKSRNSSIRLDQISMTLDDSQELFGVNSTSIMSAKGVLDKSEQEKPDNSYNLNETFNTSIKSKSLKVDQTTPNSKSPSSAKKSPTKNSSINKDNSLGKIATPAGEIVCEAVGPSNTSDNKSPTFSERRKSKQNSSTMNLRRTRGEESTSNLSLNESLELLGVKPINVDTPKQALEKSAAALNLSKHVTPFLKKLESRNKIHPHSSTPKENRVVKKRAMDVSLKMNTSAKTPSTKKFVAKKVPNFELIHQRALEKMEDIASMKLRKEQRAQLLMSGQKPKIGLDVSTKANMSNKNIVKKKSRIPLFLRRPESNLKPTTPKNKVNKFGFKVDKQATKVEQVKAVASKTHIVRAGVEDRRKHIQGVRTNRRFELMMKMRNNN
ncbi:dentin sialophosphoprotein-like [Aethina tumida]|uniref:dentin sialophosphoprotein-like n=1 Tax=Aethina tumida TaxID=116153 RepID=UPI0021491D11|nr:dentin sialophosphoprotein-like [Aethina tumida]